MTAIISEAVVTMRSDLNHCLSGKKISANTNSFNAEYNKTNVHCNKRIEKWKQGNVTDINQGDFSQLQMHEL